MILGIGTDITCIERVSKVFYKFPRQMAQKVLSALEMARYLLLQTDSQKISYIAKRFAAKEAFAKATSLGLSKTGFTNIDVLNKESGQPFIATSIDLNRCFGLQDCKKIHVEVSLSDEKSYAVAFVVIWV